VASPGVYLDSEAPHPEEAELGFWLVRPGGGLEGAATASALGGRGTFHSSWAREELDTEPPPGDHFDSLGLAAGRERERENVNPLVHLPRRPSPRTPTVKRRVSHLKCFVLYW